MKTILKINLADEVVDIYKSIIDAALKNKLRANHISECARGVQYRQTVGGFKWRYLE